MAKLLSLVVLLLSPCLEVDPPAGARKGLKMMRMARAKAKVCSIFTSLGLHCELVMPFHGTLCPSPYMIV